MNLDLRSKYYVPDGDTIELRAFTHGLMPRSVPAMMQRFVDDWRVRGVDAWNGVPNHWLPDSGETVGWWSLPEYLGDRFIAPLLGAQLGTCILQPNVHWAANALFSDVDRFRGRRIVLTEGAFPSMMQPAKRWADLVGFDVSVVPLGDDGFVDRRAVLMAVRSDTAAVVLSHVGFASGERLPDAFLQEIGRCAHESGALLVVDGYHAVGSMPIRVQDADIDVYFGGLLKEASGSSGNAFAYFREGLDIRPNLTGWFGHEDPFAFDAEPSPAHDVRRRFLGGTTAVASMYHSVEGVCLLLDAGLKNMRADSLSKTAYGIERATEAGLSLRSLVPDDRRGSMIIIEALAADKLASHLKRRGIYMDSRLGRYLRMAPFTWNTLDELTLVFDELETAVQTGAYIRENRNSSSGVVT